MKYVFETAQRQRYTFPTHVNELVLDRSEAVCSEVFVVIVEPGKAPPMHSHDDTEQIFYILKGNGLLDIEGEDGQIPVRPTDLVRIPPKTRHTVHCEGSESLEYLAVDCFPGGRPEAEPSWDAHVRVLCKEHGFDYKDTVDPPVT
ncbi:MAG: cupin domain-containing protein [Lentisphaerae bacterium]|nr:cupin domain-containing protein [Lentisphaerota bacterium]